MSLFKKCWIEWKEKKDEILSLFIRSLGSQWKVKIIKNNLKKKESSLEQNDQRNQKLSSKIKDKKYIEINDIFQLIKRSP
jgi:hypothetical protein